MVKVIISMSKEKETPQKAFKHAFEVLQTSILSLRFVKALRITVKQEKNQCKLVLAWFLLTVISLLYFWYVSVHPEFDARIYQDRFDILYVAAIGMASTVFNLL